MARQDHRVLVLTQLYAPEPNFITEDVANAMGSGARVTVVTTFPNYPAGKFYDGRWHLWPTREREGNVTVWRVPMLPDHSNSKFRRFLSYISFTIAAALVAPFVAGVPTVVWVYQTPFTAGLAALWFKVAYGSRLVFTYADLWPESMLAASVAKPGTVVDVMFQVRRWINRKADVIIGSTGGTVDRFARDGIDESRLHFIPVWVQGITEGVQNAELAPRIVYAGNIGPGQYLEPVIEAAALLSKAGSPVQFDIYGTGSDLGRLQELAERLGASNVHFRGRVGPADAFAASSASLAQLVTLRPSAMFGMSIPSKLPFCFAAGAPVLYSLVGESARVARDSGAGFEYDGSEPATLVARIQEIQALSEGERQVLRDRLRRYYRSEFSRETLLERYRAILLQPASLIEDVRTVGA